MKKPVKGILILALFSFPMSAMEKELLVDKDVAATIEEDLLTNANSLWFDEESANKLDENQRRYRDQLLLKAKEFAQKFKPADVICKGHKRDVTTAEFSPDGQTIVTASCDYTAKLWNLKGKCLTT